MEYLIRHIEDYAKLSEYEKENMLLFVKKRHFEKNEIIFTEGKIANEIYFVTKGCVRLFYNVDGKDRTAFFYTDGQFICAGESYTYNVPARENYQAMYRNALLALNNNTVNELPNVYYICPTCGNTYDQTPSERCGISMTGSEKFITINSL